MNHTVLIEKQKWNYDEIMTYWRTKLTKKCKQIFDFICIQPLSVISVVLCYTGKLKIDVVNTFDTITNQYTMNTFRKCE